MIMYSSSLTCQERRVTTSLFFNGFGQFPVEEENILALDFHRNKYDLAKEIYKHLNQEAN